MVSEATAFEGATKTVAPGSYRRMLVMARWELNKGQNKRRNTTKSTLTKAEKNKRKKQRG